MSERFIHLQQDVIDDDLRTMPPGVVNQILSCMTFEEAQEFLGGLGALRARMIYKQETLREHQG